MCQTQRGTVMNDRKLTVAEERVFFDETKARLRPYLAELLTPRQLARFDRFDEVAQLPEECLSASEVEDAADSPRMAMDVIDFYPRPKIFKGRRRSINGKTWWITDYSQLPDEWMSVEEWKLSRL